MTNLFNDELRRLRRQAGLSQSALARRAGLSTEAISLLERGRRSPRPTTIRLLADALLLGDDDRLTLRTAPQPAPSSGHAVPQYDNELVGREDLVDQVVRSLTCGPTRIVTLSGPGGVGKTRVAATAAAALRQHFPAGIRWVRVASAQDANHLAADITTALAGSHVGKLLLVIDGAEPWLEAVTTLCTELLVTTSGVRVLVTTRERLQLTDASSFVVPPLSCSSRGNAAMVGWTDSPARRLFLARAALPGPDATLSLLDDAAVTKICQHLDGVPLALELAAAHTTLLTVRQLAADLDHRRDHRPAAPGDEEAKLRETLVGATFRRSSPPEQALLARLSVFAHPFTAESVAAVCCDEAGRDAVLSTLTRLVARSLVLRSDDLNGVATFRLLRATREFAAEELRRSPAAADVHLRHAHHFRDLAARAAQYLGHGEREAWFSLLDASSEDLRRAFAWCLRHDPGSGLAMVASLWRWWHRRGHYREGRASATAALRDTRDAPAQLRGPALTAAGLLALLQCDYEAAQSLVQQGLDAYSSVGDHAGLRWSLALLGEVALQRGEYTVASQLHEQALVLARRADDVRAVGEQLNALAEVAWLRGDFTQAQSRGHRALEILSGLEDEQGIVLALVNLGVTARFRCDVDGARTLLTNSLQRSEQLDYREGVAWSLNQLGVVSRLQGDHDTARVEQIRSLEEHRRLGNRWRTASVLDELAALSIAQGDPDQATAELGAADQLRREIGAPLPPAEEPARRQTLSTARSLVGSAFPALSLPGMAGSYL